ncbi:MAG: hypothetical protein JWO60_1386, partial [Frankiales bacterium]|nr:hypothetical protein [Frankiales bacterium]
MRRARVLLSALTATTLVGGLAVAGLALDPVDPGPATFTNYAAPASLGNSAGEPTLGLNPKTGAVFFQSYTEFLKVTFDAAGKATWDLKEHLLPHVTSLDPILETDPETGRTFSSQLFAACSQMEFTDDDGESFTPSEGCGLLAAVDHQTVGVGPYSATSKLVKNPVTDYPNVVYYCAQDIASGNCSMSNDGGLTFPITSVAFATPDCGVGGLFGHLKSAPDGTVYLPPSRCNGGAAVSVSEDNGVTWKVRKVAD